MAPPKNPIKIMANTYNADNICSGFCPGTSSGDIASEQNTDENKWSLKVTGLVKKPAEYTYQELNKMDGV